MKAKSTHFRKTMAAICLIGLSMSGKAQRQNLIFEATFEPANSVTTFVSPNSFTNFANAEKCCSYSITRATDIVRNGSYAAKFDIRRPDPLGDRHRAELVMTNEPDCHQERWYGVSIYLPADFISDPEPESIFQWHEVPDVDLGENWLPSPLQITIQNNRYDCSIIWDANPVTIAPNWGSAHVDCGSVDPDKGKWTDWVFHIKWGYDNTGILEVWKNGVKVVNRINMPNTFNDVDGTYFKLGLHKWTWIGSTITTTTQRIMYADELRIGNANATYNDVAPSAVVTPPANQAPTANAGNDITITLPTNNTTLTGSGTDPDGSISSYAWTRVSGPTTFTLGNANAASTTLSNLVQGTYVFRLTVTDNGGSTATDNVTVTVNPAPNQLPTANAGNDITITLPTNNTSLNGSGTDPDGTISSYAWTRVSGPTTYTFGSANAAATTLTNLVQGTYVFRLTVTDNNNATATDNVTVTVNAAPNQLPTANAGNDITITLPTNNTSLNGSGTDPDGTIASYAWTRVSGPTTYTFGSANAAVTTLTNLVQGTYVFRLTVTDNSSATATDNVTVIVNPAPPPPNQAPTANAGNDVTLTLPTNSTTLTGSGTDPDGSIASYAWTRVSGPTTYTFGNANAASTSLTNLIEGVYVFRLTVTDDDNATATNDVTVTVNAAATPPPPPNQLPTANAGNDISITLPTNNTTLTGSGTDPDGSIASYVWSRVSGPATYTFGTANAASTTLTNLVQGTYVFRLTVRDNNNASATDDVTVTVNAAPPPPNQLPTANAGNDITITLPTNNTTLTGSGTDPDGSIATYAWSWVSGPATYTFGSANAASTSLSNLVQGVYVCRLTVTDNNGATATDNVTITVNAAPPPPPNQLPTANAGNDITITLPTNNITLTGSGTDPDGSIASYAWTRVSGPATYTLGNANAASTTLTNLVQGVYVFRLTVTDNSGATATDNVTVTVNAAPAPPPPNQAPVANAGNDIVLTLPTNSTVLNGTGSTDPDGTISTYSWAWVSGPATYTVANANAASTNLSNLVQGVYVFRLTVTDNNGTSSTGNISVTVNAAPAPPNQAPTANAGNDIVLTLPTNSTTLIGSGTDPDGTIASYTWARISGPAANAFGNANAATTTITGLVQGVYVFRLTVTDNSGVTATDNVTVTVNPPANQPPVANAGQNQATTLLANSATLNGIASYDPDGTIISYRWEQLSGPTSSTLSSTAGASINVSNLQAGDYVYRLTVTDNSNATASANVTIAVVDNFRSFAGQALYPNPAADNVNIVLRNQKSGSVTIKIYDVNGQRAMPDKTVDKPTGYFIVPIDVTNLKPGVYLVESTMGKFTRMISKFVKQ